MHITYSQVHSICSFPISLGFFIILAKLELEKSCLMVKTLCSITLMMVIGDGEEGRKETNLSFKDIKYCLPARPWFHLNCRATQKICRATHRLCERTVMS